MTERMTLEGFIPTAADNSEPIPDAGDWFGGLFDDAALFPPRQAQAAEAVGEHIQWRSSRHAAFVGPFVVSDTQWPAVREHLPNVGLEVALTVPRGFDAVPRAIAAVSADGASIVQLEVPVTPADVVEGIVSLADAVSVDATTYAEVPIGLLTEEVCSHLVEQSMRLKVRTGGTTADAFPSEYELATAIRLCVEQGLPFKLTAGLHGALRHSDPVTRFEHHGFLNVLVATAAALRGSDIAGVATILGVEGSDAVVSALRSVDGELAPRVRSHFASLGTCSIDEPLTDLRHLGLLSEEV